MNETNTKMLRDTWTRAASGVSAVKYWRPSTYSYPHLPLDAQHSSPNKSFGHLKELIKIQLNLFWFHEICEFEILFSRAVFCRISMNFFPFDSPWWAGHFVFWLRGDRITWSAAKARKRGSGSRLRSSRPRRFREFRRPTAAPIGSDSKEFAWSVHWAIELVLVVLNLLKKWPSYPQTTAADRADSTTRPTASAPFVVNLRTNTCSDPNGPKRCLIARSKGYPTV